MTAQITDGIVSLRYYRPDDTEILFEAAYESRDEIGRWMDWCHPRYSMTDAQIWINAQPNLRQIGDHPLVITDAETGTFLGSSGLNQVNQIHGFANLGYWVRSTATGGGVATRAARLVAIMGLGALGLRRMEIVCNVANAASIRVAERVGAVREGVARSRLMYGGEVADAVMFSLTRDDLPRLVAAAAEIGAHEPRIDLEPS